MDISFKMTIDRATRMSPVMDLSNDQVGSAIIPDCENCRSNLEEDLSILL